MVVVTENSSTIPLLYEQSPKSTIDLIQFPQLQETEDDDSDDDDALSLCDLPIYSSSSNGSSSLSYRNEYQEEADSFFEFGASSKSSFEDAYDCDHDRSANKDGVIFCGKLIACKDAVDQDHRHTPKPTCEKSSPKPDRVNDTDLKPKKRALFSWKRFKIASFTFRKSKKAEASNSLSSQKLWPSSSTKKDKAQRLEKMSSAKKVSTLLTSPTKSRWYLFMFGHTRFTQAMTMELSDLKNRQRRRCSPSPSMNLRVLEGGADEVERVSRRRGLWSLLKESATSASGAHANDVVRAVGSISLI